MCTGSVYLSRSAFVVHASCVHVTGYATRRRFTRSLCESILSVSVVRSEGNTLILSSAFFLSNSAKPTHSHTRNRVSPQSPGPRDSSRRVPYLLGPAARMPPRIELRRVESSGCVFGRQTGFASTRATCAYPRAKRARGTDGRRASVFSFLWPRATSPPCRSAGNLVPLWMPAERMWHAHERDACEPATREPVWRAACAC